MLQLGKFSMVDVTDGPDIDVRFGPLKCFFAIL
jgi:hypothetical protein